MRADSDIDSNIIDSPLDDLDQFSLLVQVLKM